LSQCLFSDIGPQIRAFRPKHCAHGTALLVEDDEDDEEKKGDASACVVVNSWFGMHLVWGDLATLSALSIFLLVVIAL
jgi:hypothetical protein